jgi:excisionase family DNA binding protein
VYSNCTITISQTSLSYDPNKILNLDEAAEYCGVCTRTLTSRVTEGKLKSGGTGRNYRFRVGDLDAFMFNEKFDK